MHQKQPTHDQITAGGLPPLVISLFGPFTVTVNGTPAKGFRSNKVRALLAYLLLAQPQPLLRTAVSNLLWPGYAEASAQANLRQTLTNLRDCLAPIDLLHSTRTQLSLPHNPALFSCDVHHFEALLDACARHDHHTLAQCDECRARLQAAVDLYQAPLLETFTELDSQPFNTWLQRQRTRLAGRLAEAQALLAAGATTHGNLPPLLTPLVGRTHELVEVERYLRHTVYRCVTLVGPGGIGKTHLACALGARMQANFPDGVWLVELSGLPPLPAAEAPEPLYEQLATAIAQAMGISFYGAAAPTTQLAHALADKTALLILDSFEHLRAGAGWLPTLLTAAPRLRLVVTTRHRLPLKSQVVYGVEGLGIPPAEATNGPAASHLLAQYTSVQLFVERADSAGLALPLDRETLATVGQLCRFVEGSPWAIELAVALLDQHSPATILAAIQHNYRALATSWLDVPLRQRSAEAVFHTTWALLTTEEAATLARCALFRGGFSLDAAQTVAQATPATLDALVQKSLLRTSGVQRYAMHDLVRQFAGEQLAQDGAAHQATQAAHAAYFTELLATWRPDDATEQRFRQAVTQDWENVQAAWAWALDNARLELLQQGVAGLAEFYEMTGLFLEFDHVFETAVARVRLWLDHRPATTDTPVTDLPTAATAPQRLLAHLLRHQLHVRISGLGKIAEAQTLAEELLAWTEQLADDTLAAWAYYELSMIAFYQGDYGRQEALLRQALSRPQQPINRRAQAYVLMMLAGSQQMQRDYGAAQRDYAAALALAEELGASRLATLVRNNLGIYYLDTGHFSQAIACFQQTLSRAQQIGQKDNANFALANLGLLSYLLGDYGNARALLTTAYEGYLALGDKIFEAHLLNLLALLFAEMGETTLAANYCQRALATSVAQHYLVQRSARLMQGRLQEEAGNWAAARTAYEAAYTLSAQTKIATEWLPAQARLAALHLAQGDVAAAVAALEPVLTNFAPSFDPVQRPQEPLLIAYRILVAAADPRAPALLIQAWALVQEQLAQIDDPRLRQTFLTNVPVNRALARLVGDRVATQAPSE